MTKYTPNRALSILKEIFLSNGYVKVRDEIKVQSLGAQQYKKGFEIRFLPKNQDELKLLQNAISSLGYKVSNTFLKNGKIVQPLYGKEITLIFQKFKQEKDKIWSQAVFFFCLPHIFFSFSFMQKSSKLSFRWQEMNNPSGILYANL